MSIVVGLLASGWFAVSPATLPKDLEQAVSKAGLTLLEVEMTPVLFEHLLNSGWTEHQAHGWLTALLADCPAGAPIHFMPFKCIRNRMRS